jgi:hypothetical protein
MFNQPVNRKATQVFVILKEKAHLKTNDMISLIPELNPQSTTTSPPIKIFKIGLLDALNRMSIKMETEEFDKLWKKLDYDNMGVVNSDLFLQRLGIQINKQSNDENDNNLIVDSESSFKKSSSIPNANLKTPGNNF